MSDREIPGWASALLFLAALVLAAMLLSSCAGAKPRGPGDSPAWRGCKAACEADGKAAGVLMEDDAHLLCVCSKAPAGPT